MDDVKLNRAKYLEALKIAKDSENEAIRIYTACLGYAPQEDVPKLIEIISDENDHDVIVTDLLFKATTGSNTN